MNRESENLLREFLKNGMVFVEFVKADGSLREMTCTTCESLIPKQKLDEIKGERILKKDADLMRVFDLELEDWRSFKPSRVRSFESPILQG
jgi:hypothetical protein